MISQSLELSLGKHRLRRKKMAQSESPINENPNENALFHNRGPPVKIVFTEFCKTITNPPNFSSPPFPTTYTHPPHPNNPTHPLPHVTFSQRKQSNGLSKTNESKQKK